MLKRFVVSKRRYHYHSKLRKIPEHKEISAIKSIKASEIDRPKWTQTLQTSGSLVLLDFNSNDSLNPVIKKRNNAL
jgi:hypothetical protein